MSSKVNQSVDVYLQDQTANAKHEGIQEIIIQAVSYEILEIRKRN